MSWLNSSLNTIKGQLTTLANEILEETAGPGDNEYRNTGAVVEVDKKTAIELLADTQKEKEELDKLCSEKELEILSLRKQIETLTKNPISDTGGGNAASGGVNSGRTSKTPTDNNGSSNLEDSWCWEPDNNKTDNDHSSETSSGNGNEMVNITLEEVPLGGTAKTGKTKIQRLGAGSSAEQQKRLQQLEEENKQLNSSLEELDSQHNLAMQNVLELKNDLQQKLGKLQQENESLKRQQEDKFIANELEMAKLRNQLEQSNKSKNALEVANSEIKQKLSENDRDLKKMLEELADMQSLLDKKAMDNKELIDRVKESKLEADKEREEFVQKLELLSKELEELRLNKNKKTSESSSGSSGKQSEDEFIVVREQDAASSGSGTPPSKEELKDKIVELENRLSELTLENGSLSLKLQDFDMEKDLSVNAFKENIKSLQEDNDQLNEKLRMTLMDMEEQHEKIQDLKEKASEAVIAKEQLKALAEEKLKVVEEIAGMKENLQQTQELQQRLLLAEQEKEKLQIELQNMKATQDRINELEQRIQNLTYENQQFKLNAEAETETLNNSSELEQKIKSLNEDNENLKSELERLTDSNFSKAIAEEKQFITDLDDDEGSGGGGAAAPAAAAATSEEDAFSLDRFKMLLQTFIKADISEQSTEDAEKLYKTLKEKLNKTEEMQKNLSNMSHELMDLQDNKLVWDHEKKTLEADISQYILQCDELMKNNEILLNELENYKRNKLETISEHNEENMVELESQLEECNNLNRTLEQEYMELNDKIDELEKSNQQLTEKLRETQEQSQALRVIEKDLNLQVETLELEKCNILLELNDYKTKGEQPSAESDALREYQASNESLKKQLQTLAKDHADLVSAMQNQKTALSESIQKRDELEKLLKHLEEQAKVQEKTISDTKLNKENLLEQLTQAKQQAQTSKQELLAKDIVADTLKQEIKTLQDYLKEAEQLMSDKLALEEQLGEKQQKVEELLQQLKQTKESNEKLQQETEAQASLQTVNLQLQQQIAALQNEIKALQQQQQQQQQQQPTANAESQKDYATENLSHLTHIAELEEKLLASTDLQKTVDALQFEKQEIIKAIQQKHSENMQYYMEIQRLTPLVQQLQQQHLEQQQHFEEQQQQQQQLQQPTEIQKPCDNCPSLQTKINELSKEQEKLQDQINFLKEKSDILTTNLLTEQTNQKLLQQEKSDVLDQNSMLRKDLARLRDHLLEIEDMHTRESVQMQKELEETKATMISLQEQVSKSSTAYTSASIRANQHAETLQAQYALLIQQRDELVQKLSIAEDRESKNQAALTNLQCALEQFQNDKENDIKISTQRIRKELQQHFDKEQQLLAEIQQLQQKLNDANEGLKAASRLSDQLENCQQTINVLREEVDALKQQNVSLETKLSTNESSQSDKIEKTLIKSLLIGYVVSGNPKDKHQILHMISSVLDFNQMETDKVGLNKQQSGWLGSLLGGGGSSGGTGSPSNDNLVQAFVQFLEQESQPKTNVQQMPTLLNLTHATTTTTIPSSSTAGMGANTATNVSTSAATSSTPGSRRTSQVNNPNAAGQLHQTPVPIQPLLLNSSVIDDFAPTRNSSSILKDILNDS